MFQEKAPKTILGATECNQCCRGRCGIVLSTTRLVTNSTCIISLCTCFSILAMCSCNSTSEPPAGTGSRHNAALTSLSAPSASRAWVVQARNVS